MRPWSWSAARDGMRARGAAGGSLTVVLGAPFSCCRKRAPGSSACWHGSRPRCRTVRARNSGRPLLYGAGMFAFGAGDYATAHRTAAGERGYLARRGPHPQPGPCADLAGPGPAAAEGNLVAARAALEESTALAARPRRIRLGSRARWTAWGRSSVTRATAIRARALFEECFRRRARPGRAQRHRLGALPAGRHWPGTPVTLRIQAALCRRSSLDQLPGHSASLRGRHGARGAGGGGKPPVSERSGAATLLGAAAALRHAHRGIPRAPGRCRPAPRGARRVTHDAARRGAMGRRLGARAGDDPRGGRRLCARRGRSGAAPVRWQRVAHVHRSPVSRQRIQRACRDARLTCSACWLTASPTSKSRSA